MKHIPQRSCIVCRAQKDKGELVRIVRRPDGSIVVDKSGKEAGRGAYVCAVGECMAQAVKKHALDRAFKTQLSQETCDRLLGEFEDLKDERQ